MMLEERFVVLSWQIAFAMLVLINQSSSSPCSTCCQYKSGLIPGAIIGRCCLLDVLESTLVRPFKNPPLPKGQSFLKCKCDEHYDWIVGITRTRNQSAKTKDFLYKERANWTSVQHELWCEKVSSVTTGTLVSPSTTGTLVAFYAYYLVTSSRDITIMCGW